MQYTVKCTRKNSISTSKYKIHYYPGSVMSIHVACLWMWVLFYFSLVCLHECAYAFKFQVHCGSAFEPGASGLPYYCTSHVTVPDVWRQNTLCGGKIHTKKKVLDKKNWGAIGKKLYGNREIVVNWAVGVWAPRTWLQRAKIGDSPGTKYKRSKNVFAVKIFMLILAHLGTPWHGTVTACRAVSGVGISNERDSEWNPVYKVFHRMHRCGNGTICLQ